jgi:hypothetical protein
MRPACGVEADVRFGERLRHGAARVQELCALGVQQRQFRHAAELASARDRGLDQREPDVLALAVEQAAQRPAEGRVERVERARRDRRLDALAHFGGGGPLEQAQQRSVEAPDRLELRDAGGAPLEALQQPARLVVRQRGEPGGEQQLGLEPEGELGGALSELVDGRAKAGDGLGGSSA